MKKQNVDDLPIHHGATLNLQVLTVPEGILRHHVTCIYRATSRTQNETSLAYQGTKQVI